MPPDMEKHALSKRARDALGLEYRYSRRERHPDEAPPRNYVPPEWDPRHHDIVAHVARPGALDALQIKSRGM